MKGLYHEKDAYRKADCVVFLHHNSAGGWTNGPSPSLIICNKYNGNRLGRAIARTLERFSRFVGDSLVEQSNRHKCLHSAESIYIII